MQFNLFCQALPQLYYERALMQQTSKKQAGAELGKAQLKLGPDGIKALAKSRKVVWD